MCFAAEPETSQNSFFAGLHAPGLRWLLVIVSQEMQYTVHYHVCPMADARIFVRCLVPHHGGAYCDVPKEINFCFKTAIGRKSEYVGRPVRLTILRVQLTTFLSSHHTNAHTPTLVCAKRRRGPAAQALYTRHLLRINIRRIVNLYFNFLVHNQSTNLIALFGVAYFMPLIGFDDSLHQLVAHHIARREVHKAQCTNSRKDLDRVGEARFRTPR